MGEIEEIEYETVEKSVNRFKCDECGKVGDTIEEFDTYFGFDGSAKDVQRPPRKRTPALQVQLEDSADVEKMLCESCSGLTHALQTREKMQKMRARWEGIGNAGVELINIGVPIIAFGIGIMTIGVAGFTEVAGRPATIILEAGISAIIIFIGLGIVALTVITMALYHTETRQ